MATTRRNWLQALGIGGTTAAAAGCVAAPDEDDVPQRAAATSGSAANGVAADPTAIPPPVDWSEPRTHEVTLTYEEVEAAIEPGPIFDLSSTGIRR